MLYTAMAMWLRFWEQYEMAMPMWLPSLEFWSKIHSIGEFRYSVFARRWEAHLSVPTPSCLQNLFFDTDAPQNYGLSLSLHLVFI